MIEKCPWCGLNLIDLTRQVKGGHTSWCKKKPNPRKVSLKQREFMSNFMKKNNPTGKQEFRDKVSRNTKGTNCNHHIYLKDGPTIKLTRGQHNIIHGKAYAYILEKFGREEIDRYVEWVKKYLNEVS